MPAADRAVDVETSNLGKFESIAHGDAVARIKRDRGHFRAESLPDDEEEDQ